MQRSTFWNELIDRIENDLRREQRPLSEGPISPTVPLADSTAALAFEVWQIKNRRRPTSITPYLFLKRSAEAGPLPPNDGVVLSGTQAIVSIDLLRRNGAQFHEGEVTETEGGLKISSKALRRERVRLLSLLHPDRSQDERTGAKLQLILELFDLLTVASDAA